MRWMCLGLIILAGAACSVPEDHREEGQTMPPGKGQLALEWRSDPADRGVLGSSWASATADAYELLMVGDGGNRVVDLTLNPSQIVSVDPGTWTLVVLAGVKRTSGASTAFLVGSALAEGVVVSAGQRTSVSFVLKSIDLALGATGLACWKGPVTMAASGKSRNPRVGMLLAGASTTTRPRFKADLWNGYKEMSLVSGTADQWSAEASGTVPDGVPSFTVGLVGAGVCILDHSSAWVPTTGLTHLTWNWPNRADMPDTHPLAPLSEVSVSAGPPPTGLSVTLGWE